MAPDNSDLFAINRAGGSGRTDLHVLSAASGYQQFSAHVATALGATDANWEFALAPNRDLAAVARRNTGSGSTELHVLSAGSGYQGFSQSGASAFGQTDSNWNFFLNSARDLVGVNRAFTGSGSTEVHIADMP